VSATSDRDSVATLAKTDSKAALVVARQINDPWFRAQALSWVSRFSDSDPIEIAKEAAKAAAECDDAYKRSSSRSWEIAALAERGLASEARKSLASAVEIAREVQPASSRAEAIFLILQSAAKISPDDAHRVFEMLESSIGAEDHWRCKRALRDGREIVEGRQESRQFFW
jgi:hypothetical protein